MKTIDQLCEEYLRWAADYYRKPNGRPTKTIKNIRYALGLLCALHDPTPTAGMLWSESNRKIGDLPADQFSAKLLKHLQRTLADQRKSWRTVNDTIDLVKRCFQWAADPEQELIPEDVIVRLSLVKPLRPGRSNAKVIPRMESVSLATVQATSLFTPKKITALIWLLWNTGMRPTEGCIMRKSLIERRPETWIYRPDSFKTEHYGRSREIVLGPRCRKALAEYWDSIDGDILFPGGRWRDIDAPITSDAAQACVRRTTQEFGLEHWCLKQLRKSFATRIDREFTEEDAKLLLDHSDVKVTRKHYIDPNLQRKIELMERFG